MAPVTNFEYEHLGLLHDMFRRQAKLTPKRVAIVSGDGRSITYEELDHLTDVLSENLRHKGVKPDSIVGIFMERCLEYSIAYIAILKAGGAYMPIDVSYPASLIETILLDSEPAAVITLPLRESDVKNVANIISLSNDWCNQLMKENEAYPKLCNKPSLTLDNLAYAVYSSGTTGKPKGILCPHRGAVFSYHWRHEAYPYGEDEREACNIFFVWEMLRPLLKGATMFIIPDDTIYDPTELCKFIITNKITRMLFTPSLLEAVMDSTSTDVENSFKSMRSILFCGEVVTTSLFKKCVKSLDWIQFINLYSVSEAHDISCDDMSKSWKKNPEQYNERNYCGTGSLLPGVHVVILDDELNLQPQGAQGEIYVGGPTLARGYLNRPDLNASRFIKRPKSVPSNMGDRLYRCGDWGFMRTDGSLEICGRCDSMTKIRGYSIELQAVEAALLETSDLVQNAVCVVVGEEGKEKTLVSYIVRKTPEVTVKAIRLALKRKVPFYMIPSHFVFLAKIPILASSGKLNKKALPPINTKAGIDPDSLPSTETEKRLSNIWCQVLALDAVDIHESFFDLGGHSLLATKLLNKIQEEFTVEIPVRNLFVYNTVSDLAKLLDSKVKGEGRHEIELLKVDLKKEVEKHDQIVTGMDMQLRAFWRSLRFGDRWNQSNVLLTGSTGFLGAFLIKELLLKTKMHIFCLVRDSADLAGIDRIKENLRSYGILPLNKDHATAEETVIEAKFSQRVVAVKGDISLMKLGVNEDEYNYLCAEIGFIIHTAAYVNLIYPYRALYSANVLGTSNILAFACTSKIKPLHYISTNAVFPDDTKDCDENTDMNQVADQLTEGYSQTKWVAEQLVKRAMSKGLPATIYRLGNLSGDSKQAYWNKDDFNLLLFQSCISIGASPDVDWEIEMTPVDFASSVIVCLTKQMVVGLGKILHLIETSPLKSRWLFDWLISHGYNIRYKAVNDWFQLLRENSSVKHCDSLLRLINGLVKKEEFLSNSTSYSRIVTERILRELNLSYPKLDHSLLKTYFTKMAERGVVLPVRRNTAVQKSLDKRVAVVTGASSGIGEAISRKLAEQGMRVALLARRLDNLKRIAADISKDGGLAVPIACDVCDRTSVLEAINHVRTSLGEIDVLVNNAGVMYYGEMKNPRIDEWNKQVDLNCKGVLNCLEPILPAMVVAKKGHIINITSNAGRRGFPGLAVYSGTKFFVEGLSQALRQEVSPNGIKVTTIQPGDVGTELLSHSTDTEARDKFDVQDKGEIVLVPEDIANAVFYAISQPRQAEVNEILIEPRMLEC